MQKEERSTAPQTFLFSQHILCRCIFLYFAISPRRQNKIHVSIKFIIHNVILSFGWRASDCKCPDMEIGIYIHFMSSSEPAEWKNSGMFGVRTRRSIPSNLRMHSSVRSLLKIGLVALPWKHRPISVWWRGASTRAATPPNRVTKAKYTQKM